MRNYLFILLTVGIFACKKQEISTIEDTSVSKPVGIYSSSFGNKKALDNSQTNGSLIRVKWSDIEPTKDQFDFTAIDNYLVEIKQKNLNWSLGILAGGDSPAWLTENEGIGYFEITDLLNNTRKIPKGWEPKVNERFSKLASALAEKYKNDPDLVLVYVPQMTANGIEGHFNGVSNDVLKKEGLTSENWTKTVKETARIFALAFPNKAVAVEVHEVMGSSAIPEKIINDLWNDAALGHRVGAAMWWISGKETYQSELLNILNNYPGDIYAQAIGRSDQPERFKNGDFNSMFEQAKELNVRYLEVWEFELVNDSYPAYFEDFNRYANLTF